MARPGTPGIIRELEDYAVDPDGLMMLELSIILEISAGETCASLERVRAA